MLKDISKARQTLTPAALKAFQKPELGGSLWQLTNSLGPFLLLWFIMAKTVSISYPLTLALALLASGFLVRIFIIFHDCGHGSFFKNRVANEWVGFLCGALVLTPNHEWWHNHSLHHAHAGKLDRRGHGDIWTMTVREWQEASRKTRLGYFLVRQPFFMLVVGPLMLFVFQHRFFSKDSRPQDKRSIMLCNLFLLVMVTFLCLTIGWKAYLAIHLPIIIFSGAMGIWLFYVQHQYEDVYWSEGKEHDFVRAALEGSSWYRLPKVLQWFSGNIGFHHVHHLSPRIPNYQLERCHKAFSATLKDVHEMTLWSSFKSAQLRLWDEQQNRMVGWREAMQAGSRSNPHQGT